MAIYDLLTKEYQSNLKKISTYEFEIDNLPKGSLVKVKQYNSFYYYLKVRVVKEVKSTYIGKEGDENVTKFLADIKKRKVYEKKIKEVKEDNRLILKMLKVK